MDLDDSLDEAAFRARVREWLECRAERKRPSEASGLELGASAEPTVEYLRNAKEWQACKADAGYVAMTWPKEFGGQGATPIEELIYRQEEGRFRVPQNVFDTGLTVCLPAILKHGTDDQRRRYLPAGIRGEEIWCQLFSEPAAGSDLAGIRTRAVRDGDNWRISGQKIWTSGAHFSDLGLALVRTDSKVPKHKGLSMFIVNMDAPGIVVRPIRQMTGQADFNEVFLDDACIPDGNRVGAEGDGWKVALTALMFERNSVNDGMGFIDFKFLIELARKANLNGNRAIRDSRVRERIVDNYLKSRALQLLSYRAQTALSRGQAPGPEHSIAKSVGANEGQQAAYLAMELMASTGILSAEHLGEHWGAVERSWAWGAALRIAGGSDEIARNIIAERILGMPGDVRIDKDIPFDQIST